VPAGYALGRYRAYFYLVKMNRISFIIFALLVFVLSCGKELSMQTELLVEELVTYEVMRADSSYMSIDWGAYQTFLRLKDTASLEELALLVDHEHPVVQGYSVWALVDRKYHKLPSIFSDLLALQDSVVIFFADDGGKEPLANVLYQRVTNKTNNLDSANADSLFYSKLNEKLDSLIIYSENLQTDDGMYANYLLHRALLNNQQDSSTYSRVKDLALKYEKRHALVELAKYQKERDIDVIKRFGPDAFEAVSFSPHPSFWELLLTYKDSTRDLTYFKAMAAYQNEAALKLLTQFHEQFKVENDIESIKDLDRAVIIHYDPLYADLIMSIFEHSKIIDESMTQKLLQEYPREASRAFANGLMKKKPFNFIAIDPFYTYQVKKDSIFTSMVSAVRDYDPKLIPEIFDASVLSANFNGHFIILELIREKSLEFAIPALLKRLDQKNYPFDTFHVAKTLLMFEDRNVKVQVAQILKKRKPEWDTGNWSDNFQELFKEYNIEI